jgi:hypothetical protein
MKAAPAVPSTAAEWREAYALSPERDAPFTTLSGLPVAPLYTEADLPAPEAIGLPGGYPFTRGSRASGPPRRPTSASATCWITARRG